MTEAKQRLSILLIRTFHEATVCVYNFKAAEVKLFFVMSASFQRSPSQSDEAVLFLSLLASVVASSPGFYVAAIME